MKMVDINKVCLPDECALNVQRMQRVTYVRVTGIYIVVNDFTATLSCSQYFPVQLRISLAMYSKIILEASAAVHLKKEFCVLRVIFSKERNPQKITKIALKEREQYSRTRTQNSRTRMSKPKNCTKILLHLWLQQKHSDCRKNKDIYFFQDVLVFSRA